MKKSFHLFNDTLSVLSKLTNEEKGILFQAIADYNAGRDVSLDRLMELVFEPFRLQFDRDMDAYEKKCESNKINGLRGGRPIKPKQSNENQKNPLGYSKTEANPKNHDKDTDTDTGTDKENEKENVWEGVFSNAFASEWATWVKFRKQIKKPLKGESEQRNFNNLVKLSGGNEQTAIAIIDQSIAQGWTGLFELKQSQPTTSQPTTGFKYRKQE